MMRSARFGVIACCMLMGCGVLSMVRAQSHPTPNPYLSRLPGGLERDMIYWQARMQAQAIARRAAQTRATGRTAIKESEPNNSQRTGNTVGDFGNAPGQTPSTDVSGDFPEPPAPTLIDPFAEDDGAIPSANNIVLSVGQRVRVKATLGDGPHGSAGSRNGDFDFYAISGVTTGQIITADIDTQSSEEFFDSFLAIWDSAGNLLGFNEDDSFDPSAPPDSFLLFTAPKDGTYYISVGSFEAPYPRDPFDSSSGPGFFTEGPYELILGLNAHDVDYFILDLKAGDVLNVNGLGAITHVSLFDPMGGELITSDIDITPILPEAAPFAAGDNPSWVYVINQPGTYGVRVTGRQAGVYLTELRTARPPLEAAKPGTKQILFIDFDGAVIETERFGGFRGRRLLSPLRTFLNNWGLPQSEEGAVIDAILAVIQENFQNDIPLYGNNPHYAIDIRNSRDHDDPFGKPHVSRVIVGGSILESGIPVISIAESIDVGNFDTAETALVMLDVLSAPSGDPDSINTFPMAASASMIDFVGTAVGNIVSQEAGHLFGNFNTDAFNTSSNIMDQGGNPANTFGVGNDGTFGTADDVDVDFGLDHYVPEEGLVGIEDTLNVIAFGLTSVPMTSRLFPMRPLHRAGD